MLFSEKPKNAGAGANILNIKMAPGTIIKHIAARNETKPWQYITISLADGFHTTGSRYYAIIPKIPQPGDRDVVWRGKFKIDSPFVYILASISNCDVDDKLWLVVGYEMPEKKHGWGK